MKTERFRKTAIALGIVILMLVGGCGKEQVDVTSKDIADATDVIATSDETTKETEDVTISSEDVKQEIRSTEINVKPVVSYATLPEKLDRGIVAAYSSEGVFISWRLLETDTNKTYFYLYKDGVKIASTGDTNYLDKDGVVGSKYYVESVLDGKVGDVSKVVDVWSQDYLSVKLDIPETVVVPRGNDGAYRANDVSIADLDGDGEFEIVLKWDPTNSKDNSQGGYTGNVYLDAYKLDGTKLWRIDLGVNIRAGAHYTQFMVYDFDGDGKAEVACKTGDGTVDGVGKVIGKADVDYRTFNGYILTGPEYLTVFNGVTGAAMDTIDFEEARGTLINWGDNGGNRVDRFLACVAYLDGKTPSFVMCRGYYAKTTLTAYNFVDGKIQRLWHFDTDEAGKEYKGQGNHNLSVVDVDYDGRDEIVYGSMTIDNDGKVLYSTGLGHGDAMHVSDIDPTREGLEVFQVHESGAAAYHIELHDAQTGEILWGIPTGTDTGRGVSADIDPRYVGMECWAKANGKGGIYTAYGELITENVTVPSNFTLFWDGDLLSELFDGSETTASNVTAFVHKHMDMNGTLLDQKIKIFEGTDVNNYTKANPCLSGDIIGDWREEVILRSLDSSELRIYTTTIPTEYRLTTLLQDRQYRLALAWQNVAYNQPPHTSYYIGSDMEITTGFTGTIK